MSEVILIPFPDIAGDATTFTAFMRNQAGALLNTGGDVVTEPVTTLRAFTLAEARTPGSDYFVRIYSGTTETRDNLVYDDVLCAGQLIVGQQWNPTVIRGVVGATAPTIVSFTPSSVTPAPSALNQWAGRILIFDNNTVSAALRGKITDITGSSAAALPLLTYSAIENAPVSNDTFLIV